MANLNAVDIGPWRSGAIPDTYVHQFLEADGTTAIDVSGGTFAGTIREALSSPAAATALTVIDNDGVNGKVEITWPTGDGPFPNPGEWLIEVWATAGAGGRPLASDMLRARITARLAATRPV